METTLFGELMPHMLNTPPSSELKPTLEEIAKRPAIWAAAATLATPWLINTWAVPLWINEFWDADYPRVVFYLLTGLIGAEFTLAMIWLAWGTWHLLLRSIIVAIGAAVTFKVGSEDDSLELSVMWLAILSLGALAFALPRFFGVKLVQFDWDGRPINQSSKRHNQFSVLDILSWTAVAAMLMFVLFQWNELPEDLRGTKLLEPVGIAAGVLVLASAPSIVAMWCDFGPLYWRIIGVFTLIAAIVGIVNFSNGGGLEMFLGISTTFWFGTALIMAVLAVPRALGYRLVWRSNVQ